MIEKMSEEDLLDWLTLFHAEGLSPATLCKLLLKADTLSALRSASSASPLLDDLTARACAAALASSHARKLAESSIRWRECADNAIVCLSDNHYPPLLRQIADPPPVLFVRGNLNALSIPQIAVVGSRRCSIDGRENTALLVSELARQGLSVCSGLAAGIDTAAHKAALDAGGITVGVVGTGIDVIYPRSNALLASRIMETGALVSEFPLGYPPLSTNFPRRNRIISGLSLGVLVIEAALQSGSLITARLAMEQNREVFAVPGSIRNPLSRGCHRLIREGATLTESVQDLWDHLAGILGLVMESLHKESSEVKATESFSEDSANQHSLVQKRLLMAMGYDPVSFDILIDRTQMDMSDLQALLLELELSGMLSQESGRYCLRRLAPLQGQ